MTFWLIFGGVILLILGLLMIPVHVTADYKEKLFVKIRFLLFFKLNVFPFEEKEKEEKEKPKKQKKEKTKAAEQKPKRKRTAEETIDFIIDIVKKYGPGARMILRNIRFHNLELYWKVGAEDAAACGLKYGKVCAWLSGVFGFFRNFVKIEKSKLRVFPDFICEKDEIYGGADIEFNPLIVIIGALRMAVVFIKDAAKSSKKPAPKAHRNIKAKESA